jgi:hypothetical protein
MLDTCASSSGILSNTQIHQQSVASAIQLAQINAQSAAQTAAAEAQAQAQAQADALASQAAQAAAIQTEQVLIGLLFCSFFPPSVVFSQIGAVLGNQCVQKEFDPSLRVVKNRHPTHVMHAAFSFCIFLFPTCPCRCPSVRSLIRSLRRSQAAAAAQIQGAAAAASASLHQAELQQIAAQSAADAVAAENIML